MHYYQNISVTYFEILEELLHRKHNNSKNVEKKIFYNKVLLYIILQLQKYNNVIKIFK